MGKVYRIENRFKRGPYVSDCKGLDTKVTERHPLYLNDSLLMARSKNKPSIFRFSENSRFKMLFLEEKSSIFAFSTISQLRFWFHDDEGLKEMHTHRFRVVIYEVNRNHCVRGRTQCIFNKNHATKIGTISLLKFLSENA